MNDHDRKESELRNAADRATLPFRLLEQMQIPCGYERSFKMLPGKLLANRYLLGVDLKNLNSQQLRTICQRLNMPEEFFPTFDEYFPGANLVFVGFEDNPPSGTYKVYLEFWERVKSEVQSNPTALEPRLLHLGFKWNVADNTQRTVSRYVCHPRLSIEGILQRLTDVYAGHEQFPSREIVTQLISFAASRAEPNSFIYLEVLEGDSPRRSFDLNLYSAMLPLNSIWPELVRLRNHFGLPTGPFDQLGRLTSHKLLGHVSGGLNQHGDEFVTIYYEV